MNYVTFKKNVPTCNDLGNYDSYHVASQVILSHHMIHRIISRRGAFKNTYYDLDLKALNISTFYQTHIFQCKDV